MLCPWFDVFDRNILQAYRRMVRQDLRQKVEKKLHDIFEKFRPEQKRLQEAGFCYYNYGQLNNRGKPARIV